MWWISRTAALCILTVLSYIDIRIHKVPVVLLAFSNTVALVYYFSSREVDIWTFLGGIGIGILFLLISKVTGEGVGYGDSWGILILGIYLGFWELLEVLSVTFLFLAVFAMVNLWIKKMPRKCVLPFFPFLTGGYLVVFLIS